ncbi:hypothetical protein ACJX0J_008850, partial [Zea mays]
TGVSIFLHMKYLNFSIFFGCYVIHSHKNITETTLIHYNTKDIREEDFQYFSMDNF